MIIGVSFFAVFKQADGYTDPYYIRFTTPRQNSLIVGTSRAAQGIQPQYVNEKLAGKQLFNYSFNIAYSPYGPWYLNSIREKLNRSSKDGIFILAVDPWSICKKYDGPADTVTFEESEMLLANTKFVSLDPNIPYLLNNYDRHFYHLLLQEPSPVFLHKDGWLEVTVPMDSTSMMQRTQQKVADYKKNSLPIYKFSQPRFDYLGQTIDFLGKHGSVFLVRLPVHPLVMDIDQQLMPDFDQKIKLLSSQKNIPYLDMSPLNARFQYTDGSHIYKESSKEVSALIGEWISKEISPKD